MIMVVKVSGWMRMMIINVDNDDRDSYSCTGLPEVSSKVFGRVCVCYVLSANYITTMMICLDTLVLYDYN